MQEFKQKYLIVNGHNENRKIFKYRSVSLPVSTPCHELDIEKISIRHD